MNKMELGSSLLKLIQIKQNLVLFRDSFFKSEPLIGALKKVFFIAPIFCMIAIPTSQAQVVFVEPNTANNQFCQIAVINGGLMMANVVNKRLGTKEQRASSAVVQVNTSNSSFDLIVKKPLGFIVSPRGANGNVVFKTAVTATGATNFTEITGDHPIRLKRGITNLVFDLTIDKLDGPFNSGKYEAAIRLQCER